MQDAAAAERRLVVSWVLFPVAVLAGLAAVFGVEDGIGDTTARGSETEKEGFEPSMEEFTPITP